MTVAKVRFAFAALLLKKLELLLRCSSNAAPAQLPATASPNLRPLKAPPAGWTTADGHGLRTALPVTVAGVRFAFAV